MIRRLVIILPVILACSLTLSLQPVQQYIATQAFVPQPCTILGCAAGILFFSLPTKISN